MTLPPLSYYPLHTETANIDPEDAIAAIAAVLTSAADPSEPRADMGMQTHLWMPRPTMTGAALCGASPRGIYKQWHAQVGEQVNCPRCLRLHAEVLSTSR